MATVQQGADGEEGRLPGGVEQRQEVVAVPGLRQQGELYSFVIFAQNR